MPAVVLAIFQVLYPSAKTNEPIRQLKSTDTKAASEKLIISFLENNNVQ